MVEEDDSEPYPMVRPIAIEERRRKASGRIHVRSCIRTLQKPTLTQFCRFAQSTGRLKLTYRGHSQNCNGKTEPQRYRIGFVRVSRIPHRATYQNQHGSNDELHDESVCAPYAGVDSRGAHPRQPHLGMIRPHVHQLAVQIFAGGN